MCNQLVLINIVITLHGNKIKKEVLYTNSSPTNSINPEYKIKTILHISGIVHSHLKEYQYLKTYTVFFMEAIPLSLFLNKPHLFKF